MITSKTKELGDHSQDEDVLIVENYSKAPQSKKCAVQQETAVQSKRVYYSLSSSQADDEEAREERPIGNPSNEDRVACMKTNYVEESERLKEERDKQSELSPPSIDFTTASHSVKENEVAKEQNVLQHDHELQRSSHSEIQKRHHLDDDTSFFFRGHNISEGVKRAAALYDNTDTRHQSKPKRKHHNMDLNELGNEKSGDKLKAQSDVDSTLHLKFDEGLKDQVTESSTPIKYDATYDPEFAKLLAKYTVRGVASSLHQSQQEGVKPILDLKSVNSPVASSLNINAHCQRDGKVATSLFACGVHESFGDINEALHCHFRRNFTLMYRKTPILSSLATPEVLGIARGSTIEAFDDFTLEAFKALQEKEQTGRRELLEAEQLASSSVQPGNEDVSEGDQDGADGQVDTHLWTMRVRINAKQTESIQINPDDAVSRLLCLVLEKIERAGSCAVLVWDGIALPANAIIRDADLEDGDQLELHFRQT